MTLTGAGKVAAVIGWPIAQSKSPQIHQYWIDRHQLDGVVVPFAVRPDDIGQALEAFVELGIVGASVTLPHKQTCIPLLHEVSPLVKTVGACNMIRIEGDCLIGDNTDVFGFVENLKQGLPKTEWPEQAMVLGAGGAARAIIAGLADLGVTQIFVANRTVERAATLASQMAAPLGVVINPIPWTEISNLLGSVGILVNTTSLGMVGQPALDIDLENLKADCIVNDIVYNPLETDLLKGASAKGCPTVDGLGMLLHQARPAFKAWFGVDPIVENDQRHIVLNATAGN